MNRILQIIIAVVVIVVIAGASFYGGMVYGQNRASTASAAGFADRQFTPPDGQDGSFPGFRGQNGGAGGFTAQPGTTFGQIESIEGNTLTVTDRNGNQVQVQVADTTLIEKNASVSVTDLAAGDTVIVSGGENDDGSITARSVQVAPAGRLFGGNPNGAQNGQ